MSKNFKCAVCGSIVSEDERLFILGEPVPTCPHCNETDMLFPVQEPRRVWRECCECGFSMPAKQWGNTPCPCGSYNWMDY